MSNVIGKNDQATQAGQPQQSSSGSSETNTAGMHRRAFVTASAGAAVLAASRGFAQNKPSPSSVPTGAFPANVKVERLDGSILLIGFQGDRTESLNI